MLQCEMCKELSFLKLVVRPHSGGNVANRLRFSKFRYVKDLKDPQDGGNVPAVDMQTGQQSTD